MEAIVRIATQRDLVVIEDCAHGPGIALHGRQAGSFGQIACWSLQQSKMLTAAGEGGLATTDDDTLAARLRQVCDHGKDKTEATSSDSASAYRVTALGNNYRLSEMQAAFARAQLGKLEELTQRRRAACAILCERLREIPGLEFRVPDPHAELSSYSFPLLFPGESFRAPAAQISAAMHAEGVGTLAIAQDELIHVHPLFAAAEGRATATAFRLRGDAPVPPYGWGTLPVAEKIAGELLLLPMHPGLSAQDLDDMVEATRKVAGAYRR
jgi:dTDP-4-amino-4,6-dideoxygalactose transaminase